VQFRERNNPIEIAILQWRHWGEKAGGNGVTPSRGMTSDENYFLWLNLERILDKGRGKMGVVRRR